MERQKTLNAQENKRLTQLQSPYWVQSQHNSSQDRQISDKSTLHILKEQTLQSVEDFKNFFSAQVSGLPSGSGSRLSQPVPTDYHNKTVTNLPKIKQLLHSKQLEKRSTASVETAQNQNQNFISTKFANLSDFQDQTITNKMIRKSIDRNQVIQNDQNYDQGIQNNFYSTFNFKVMHSRSTDFMEEDQFTQSRLQTKQIGGVHKAGGAQFKNWNHESSQDNNMTRYPQFQVAKYRNIPTLSSEQVQVTQDENKTKLSSQFRLNRFEQFSVDRAFANKTQQLQYSDTHFDNATKIFQNKQLHDDSADKDFNFKRKKNRIDYNIYEKTSIFTSVLLNESTEPSVLQQNTTFNPKDSVFGTSTLVSKDLHHFDKNKSQQISNIKIFSDLPKKVQMKCKVQLQKQIENAHTVQPSILQHLLKKQHKQQNFQNKEGEVASQLVNRELLLKQRPAKLRLLSAQQRRQMLAKTLQNSGFELDDDIQDNLSAKSTEQTSNIAETSDIHHDNKKRLFNYSTTQFNNALSRSTIPRLTHITMIQESRNFNVQMAHQQFQHLFNACSTGNERAIINDAYKHFHEEISNQVEQDIPLKEIQVKVRSSESDSSFSDSVEEELDWKQDDDERKFRKIMKVINKGLVKYRKILQKNLDTQSMKSKLENLDMKYVQQQVEETARQRRKNLPLQGDDLYLVALQRVRELTDKFGKIQFDNNAGIRNYTHLLEATDQVDQYGIDNKLEEQKKHIPQINSLDSARSHTSVQQLGKIKRGFLLMPNSLDIEKVDIDEVIDDPEIMFENYVQRVKQDKKSAGMDFLNKFEDQRISGIYNFNSTIYEKNPTSRVAYFTACKRQVELALPVLSKIKNQELVLTDYRLDSGHFEALGISFLIEPEIVNRITLVNCGLDEAATTSLFKAVKSLKCIEYISLCKTDLSHESVFQLKDLVINAGGWGLKELKLKDVKMNPKVAESFFKMLTERSYLKTLSLVNFNFTEKTFSYFTEYFSTNQALRNLDISYASGIRPPNYIKFFEALAQNKLLNSLNLSWNNFIEDQPAAFLELQNPYKVFKAMYEKWIKMGPGARWPGKPDPKAPVGGGQKSPKKQAKPTPKGGRVIITMPEFIIVEKTEEVPQKLKNDEEENLQSQMKADQEKEIARIVKQCILFAFQKRMIKKPDPKSLKNKQETEEIKQQQSDFKELELVSTQALMVTEAIYKFIRRNQRLQHLDLTKCNLGQVMLGRIGQGVKCSKTLMGVHFSDNPGVTPALKAFLQVKMKAKPPQTPHDKINNAFIDKPANLEVELKQQLDNLKTEIYLAHETVILKEQGKKKSDVYLPSDPSLSQNKTLVFTRLLGHKLQIPDSGRWKILTQPQQECWICKKYVVALFFWNQKQIGSHQVPEHVISKEKLLQEIKGNHQIGTPYIFGQFNSWNPAKMMKVSDFALLPRTQKKPNFLQIVVKKFNLGPGFETIHDLKPEHKTYMAQLQLNYQKDPSVNWRRYIAAMSRFQQPCLVNYEYFNQESFDKAECTGSFNDLESNPLYVYAALVKPGKHHFLIQFNQDSQVIPSKSGSPISYTSGSLGYQGSSHTDSKQLFDRRDVSVNLDQKQEKIPRKLVEQFYLHRSIIPQRSEEIPVMYKAFVEQVAVRQFFHRLSVFAPWKPDNASIINKCVENDILAMNLGKYLKESEDISRMEKVIKKYIPYLKDVHIDLVCESDFPPFVTFLDFMNFTQTCKFASDGLKQASIELIYVQVDTNVKARNGIVRGEFLEALIRVAKAKYVETGIEKRLDVALEKLVESLIKPNWPADRWQKLRDKKFWNNEVNDILQVNLEGLKMLHRKFWDLKALPKKKFMSLKECESLLVDSKLKINLKTIRRSFIMAKMTCSDERTKIDSYNKLQFVEFLEFLCRVALDYEDASLGNTTITQIQKRLEVVLDEVLAYIGLQRREVVMETFMDSDADLSDDEY